MSLSRLAIAKIHTLRERHAASARVPEEARVSLHTPHSLAVVCRGRASQEVEMDKWPKWEKIKCDFLIYFIFLNGHSVKIII